MTTQTKTATRIRSSVSTSCLTAIAIALAGCNGGAPDACDRGACVASATSAALEVTPAPTPPPQQAAGVEVYVQSPFDFQSGAFDLDKLESFNGDPVFSDQLAIPYDIVEASLRAKLAELTAQPFGGEFDGPAGSTVLWSVGLSVDAHFSQRGQPVLSPWGSATDNGVRVALDTQLEVNLNAHVHVHTTDPLVPDPHDFDVPMHALIGGHGHVNLAFFPVIRADGLEAWATLDQCDVDIVGLDGDAITAGAVIGGAIGWVTGGGIIEDAFLGAITGEAALEEAKDLAKDMMKHKAGEAFESSRAAITAVVNKAVQPAVAQANAVLDGIRNQVIPGVGQTLGQLESQLGMSLDIRSVTQDDVFRTAFTARFANVPADGTVSGRLRFPKRRCAYGLISNELLGKALMPIDLVDANTEMAAAGCANVDAAGLLSRVYYGANPDAVLKTDAPENNLVTWGALGSVQLGTMTETPDSYECPFTIVGLPSAAFVDMRPGADSSLSRQLSNRSLMDGAGGDPSVETALHKREAMGQGRFALVTADGVSIVLDHTGQSPAVVDIGNHAPASIDDCPMVPVSGGSNGLAPGFDPGSLAPDPENCPACGAQETPGADVVDETPAAEGANSESDGPSTNNGGGSSGAVSGFGAADRLATDTSLAAGAAAAGSAAGGSALRAAPALATPTASASATSKLPGRQLLVR